MSKRVRFSAIMSIIVSVTSLFYVILSVAYFIAMGATLVNGNEYEMLGFVFGLFGLPVVIAVLAIPIFRIIIMICSLNLSKKQKEGSKAKGLVISVGVMQIIDAVVSPIVFGFIGSIIVLIIGDMFQSIPGGGFLYSLLILTFNIPVLLKGVAQIISSVFLFKSKGELF